MVYMYVVFYSSCIFFVYFISCDFYKLDNKLEEKKECSRNEVWAEEN